MVDKFNRACNMNITYVFFLNKLDELKKHYKRWMTLMNYNGISVDLDTSMIYASDTWWKEHENVSTHNFYSQENINIIYINI